MVAALATASLSLDPLRVGFGFRPTDQELVVHYLWRKISGKDVEVGVIREIDVNEKEPWDMPRFFFSQWRRKYPNGNSSDRATKAGHWKPTGNDREIKSGGNLIGMKKTLVFHEGRAPGRGKTRWVMHEYRTTAFPPGQGAFVLCRLFEQSDETLRGSTFDAAEALATAGLSLNSPPVGFGFRPTDQELVGHFLWLKIIGRDAEVEVISEIDVCTVEPWDLPDLSAIPTRDPEWFFFSRRYRKHPNGNCFNRATTAGYWKPTGQDREIKFGGKLIGMKKTLVFRANQILGIDRAPGGDPEKSRWVMHEYRTILEGPDGNRPGQDAFVLCRLFDKLGETLTGSTSVDENEEAMMDVFDYERYGNDCGEP